MVRAFRAIEVLGGVLCDAGDQVEEDLHVDDIQRAPGLDCDGPAKSVVQEPDTDEVPDGVEGNLLGVGALGLAHSLIPSVVNGERPETVR